MMLNQFRIYFDSILCACRDIDNGASGNVIESTLIQYVPDGIVTISIPDGNCISNIDISRKALLYFGYPFAELQMDTKI